MAKSQTTTQSIGLYIPARNMWLQHLHQICSHRSRGTFMGKTHCCQCARSHHASCRNTCMCTEVRHVAVVMCCKQTWCVTSCVMPVQWSVSCPTLLNATKDIVCSIMQNGSCLAYLMPRHAVLTTCVSGAILHRQEPFPIQVCLMNNLASIQC